MKLKNTQTLIIIAFAALLLTAGAAKLFAMNRAATVSKKAVAAVQQKDAAGFAPARSEAAAAEVNHSDAAVLADLKKNLVVNLPARGVPVLMYHHVGDLPANPDAIRKDLTVSTADFQAQLDYLKSAGYQTVSAEQLYLATQGKFKLPSKPIAITFDDGYQDVFDNAVPALKARGMIGSFGIITQYAGQPGYASWQNIVDAKAAGMEIVSHSQHHIDFTSAKYKTADKFAEIDGSKKDLQQELNLNTNLFIYPYGHLDAVTEALLQNAGYQLAFTTAFGNMRNGQDMLAVPRVRVHGAETLPRFIEILDIAQGKKILTTR